MIRSDSPSSAGQQWMWADVFVRHHAAFFTYALHFEPRVHDAEDLVQSALLRLAQRGRPDGDAVAYAMAAIRNLALDQRRRRVVRVAAQSTDRPTTPAPGLLDADEAARLRAAFDRLDDGRREVVILKVFGELTLQQIARILEQPLGTVASAYRRALIEIRSTLEKERQHHEPTRVTPISPR